MDIKPGGLVAVDFDGVINSYTTRGPALVDEPEPGALEFIKRLIDAELVPVVFTTRARSPYGIKAVKTWLAKWGFPDMEVTADKFAALAYVDDRAAPYVPRSGDWDSVWARLEDLAGLNERRGVEELAEFTLELADTNV